MPKVTVIPSTVNPLTHLPSTSAEKRRVAGYARVSTDSDEQFTSYEAQVDYYTNFIQSKPESVVQLGEQGAGCSMLRRKGGFIFGRLISAFLCTLF